MDMVDKIMHGMELGTPGSTTKYGNGLAWGFL